MRHLSSLRAKLFSLLISFLLLLVEKVVFLLSYVSLNEPTHTFCMVPVGTSTHTFCMVPIDQKSKTVFLKKLFDRLDGFLGIGDEK